MGRVVIRERNDADLAACTALFRRTHATDGYPRYDLPDMAGYIASSDIQTDAWVATLDDEIVGHVALHVAEDDECSQIAARASDLPMDRLTVLGRLAVSPDARGLGIATQLIASCIERAAERDQLCTLDVLQESPDPIALYERLGWTRVGATTITLPGDYVGVPDPEIQLNLFVYNAPSSQI